MDEEYRAAGVCGLYCGACDHFDVDCEGCGAQAGSPYWGECDLYLCCVEERGLEFCGECDEFPCSRYLAVIEHPSFPPWEEMEESVIHRMETGTESWLEDAVRKRAEMS